MSDGYFAAILLLLAMATTGSFAFKGALGWACGMIYVLYDTALLAFTLWKAAPLLHEEALERREKPAGRVGVAVLVPARNEGLVLTACLEALLSQDDPPEEILVVDDGSTDETLPELESRYEINFEGPWGRSARHPALAVLRKRHSGKARSLNEAWPQVSSEVVVTIDADTILEPGAISAMRRAFEAESRLTAACGVITPKCRPGLGASCLEIFQRFEYIRANLGRVAWMRCGTLLMVPGAFAAYRKEALGAVGGFNPESLVEDYDVIHRIHRWSHERHQPATMRIIPDARAVTDAPNNIKAFLKQRQRWFAGFLQTQFENMDMIGNPRYGAVGTFMLPIKSADTLEPIYGILSYFLLLKLMLLGGKAPSLALWILGPQLALNYAILLWSIHWHHKWQGRGMGASDFFRASIATLLEPFGFRLLRHVAALTGWFGFLEGTSEWTPQRPSRLQALSRPLPVVELTS